MKILRITSNSDKNFLEEKIQSNKTASFENIISIYKQENLIKHRSLKNYLKELEFKDVIIDDAISQFQWLKESLPDLQNKIKLSDIIYEQINLFQPNIIFVVSGAGYLLKKENFKIIKNICSAKTILYWGDEFPDVRNFFFSYYDKIITINKGYQKKFNKIGIKSSIIPYCIDSDDLVKNCDVNLKKYDFTFSGSTGFKQPDHSDRLILLKKILNKSNLIIKAREKKHFSLQYKKKLNKYINYLSILPPIISRIICSKYFFNFHYLDYVASEQRKKKIKNLIFELEKEIPIIEYLPNRISSGVYGQEYFNFLRESRICLNVQRNEFEDYSNIRTFEVTGSKSCLITNSKNVSEFFDIDNEVVSFSNMSEFKEKYNYLSENQKKIDEISNNGFKKTKESYTTRNFAQLFLQNIKDLKI